MRTNFPLKKTFEQDFLNKKWDKIFTLKYEQATISEYYEYLTLSPEEQTHLLYWILKSQVKLSFFEKIMTFFFKNYVWKIEKWLKVNEILINIFQNKFRFYKSIFDWLRKIDRKSKWSIESAWLSAICKNYCISPTDLMKNYTLEQYFWFLDWIEWNNNAISEEWKAINNMAIIDKEAIKKRADETKKAFEKVKKAKKS